MRTGERPGGDQALLAEFDALLHPGSLVLDAGCGACDPIAKRLALRHRVIGIDFSAGQLTLARQRAPEVWVSLQDMSDLAVRSGVCDALVSFYALIHVPRERHGRVYVELARVLRPGGLALVCNGAQSWEGTERSYHGAGMFWSHHGPDVNEPLMRDAGFEVEWTRNVTEEVGGVHAFTLARKS